MRGTRVHQEIGRSAPPRGESRPDDDVTHACLGSTLLRLSEGRSMTMAHPLSTIHNPFRRPQLDLPSLAFSSPSVLQSAPEPPQCDHLLRRELHPTGPRPLP